MTKVAIVTGSTRGIGREIALTLSELGYNIVVVGKTIDNSNKNLPGTIYSVKKEIEDRGGNAFAFQLDVQNTYGMVECIEQTILKWGRIDVLVNNAGALWWKKIEETPIKRYDLINNINSRATFVLSRLCIPYMKNIGGGFIINCSPPLRVKNKDFNNKTAYLISKLGMTMTAIGIGEEHRKDNICACTLWPKTAIESYAVKNHGLGSRANWRKPSILTDCIRYILNENKKEFSGSQLIDEDYLRSKGITNFDKYSCIEGTTPENISSVPLWDAGRPKL